MCVFDPGSKIYVVHVTAKIEFDVFLLTIGLVIRDVDVRFPILSDSFLKKVSFSLERDHLHPLKWVLNLPEFWDS